jgi:hypothetical protein
MHPVWLIEAGVYGSEADPLLAEIRRQGMAAQVVPFRALLKGQDIVAGGVPGQFLEERGLALGAVRDAVGHPQVGQGMFGGRPLGVHGRHCKGGDRRGPSLEGRAHGCWPSPPVPTGQ